MASFSSILEYYSRSDVQKALLEIAKNREVVGVYPKGNFDKRPNVLVYPDDILQMIKKGVTSFHGSLEHWSNPMQLSTNLSIAELDKLRTGWDLIIDPDCIDFEISKLTVATIIEALEDHDINNYSIKFTGGKGFHIGVQSQSFPKTVNAKPIELLYPDLPKAIIEYLKAYTREQLKEKILEIGNTEEIAKRVNKKQQDVVDKDGLDPFKIVSIDSGLVSSRHLFRLPYSLHEKSHLISLPLNISSLKNFKREDASIDKVKDFKIKFLNEKTKLSEATSLVIESFDFLQKMKPAIEQYPKVQVRERKTRYFDKRQFPPCMLKLLEGKLSDGRKRGLFLLVTFLRNMGWSWEQVEKEVLEWNEKNLPPLRTNYVKTQLRWHKNQKKNILPPNCNAENYYKELGLYCGDEFHKDIKNPINYPYKKYKK